MKNEIVWDKLNWLFVCAKMNCRKFSLRLLLINIHTNTKLVLYFITQIVFHTTFLNSSFHRLEFILFSSLLTIRLLWKYKKHYFPTNNNKNCIWGLNRLKHLARQTLESSYPFKPQWKNLENYCYMWIRGRPVFMWGLSIVRVVYFCFENQRGLVQTFNAVTFMWQKNLVHFHSSVVVVINTQ